MVPIFAILVALACATASARRVWFAANATAVDPDEILKKLERANGPEAIDGLRALVAREPAADWERDLLAALASPPEHRAAYVGEQLTELNYRIRRWARVPRVCASIASKVGFILAAVTLLAADTSAFSSDVSELVVNGPIGDALLPAAIGLVGMAFCAGAHGEAKRIAKARIAGADKLVERLETLVGQHAPEAATT